MFFREDDNKDEDEEKKEHQDILIHSNSFTKEDFVIKQGNIIHTSGIIVIGNKC